METNKPNVGDIFEVEVEGIGKKDDRVCKHEGFVIFVEGSKAEKGELISVRVTKVRRKVGFGEQMERRSQ